MEDEKKINDAELSAAPLESNEQQTQEAAVSNDPLSQDGASAQGDVVTQEGIEPLEAQSAQELAWEFGEQNAVLPQQEHKEKKKSAGMGAFFAVFGGIFGVCILLLFLTLWLGDEGFEIIRNLKTERVIYVREDDGTSGLLTPNEAADKIKKSTVTVLAMTAIGNSTGSGFVYSDDGYIITNYHVVEGSTAVQVVLPNGIACDATVKGYDEAADIAVLKIEATGLVPVELGSSAELLVGEDVVAVGTPAKLDYAGTATFGKVSATSRLISLSNSSGTVVKKMTLIQTDTSVNPGNSGGPLADMYGRVVGVVVMKITEYGGTSYDGIGFALPIDGVKQIADAIIKSGTFNGKNPIAEGRSLLGVTGHGGEKGMWYSDTPDPTTGAMIPSETEQEGYHFMKETGVYVTAVNGGDAVGNMQTGDIITRINGMQIRAVQDLIGEANRHYAGEAVTLTVLRGDSVIEISIRLYEE